MVQITEVKENQSSRESRTAAHTHIKGLGLNEQGIAKPIEGGFVDRMKPVKPVG